MLKLTKSLARDPDAIIGELREAIHKKIEELYRERIGKEKIE